MLKNYIPNMYKKSIYDIDYQLLKRKNIKLLLFDLDNTLIPPHVKESNEKVNLFIKKRKEEGFQVVLFSNSPYKRVRIFKQQMKVEVNAFSLKPMRHSFYKIMKKYKKGPREIAIIGDQLVTDIIGGNKVGIYTILVSPICKEDAYITGLNRKREKHIMKKLKKQNLFTEGIYYNSERYHSEKM